MANKKEVPTGKVPPQNLDAEMSLLGAVLIDDDEGLAEHAEPMVAARALISKLEASHGSA